MLLRSFFLITTLICNSSFAITELTPGDIAITGFNFRNPDEFSFITFKNLDPGTILYFTDCGWKDDGTFRKGEGLITYLVPEEGRLMGEVIIYPYDPGFSTQGVEGFFGFSSTGDQIIVFQGNMTSPKFIYALNCNDSDWYGNAVDNNTSKIPDGLIIGVSALALEENQNAIYHCLYTNDDLIAIQIKLFNSSNWITSDNRFNLADHCLRNSLANKNIEVKTNLTGKQIRVEAYFNTDQYGEIILELSEDGYHFSEMERRATIPGLNHHIFNLNTHSRYFRFECKEQNQNYYSSIQRLPDVLANPIEFHVFDHAGRLLFTTKELNISDFNINIPFGSNCFVKKIYSTHTETEIVAGTGFRK